jgi:ABC exporter DevB family membrane fusion protein
MRRIILTIAIAGLLALLLSLVWLKKAPSPLSVASSEPPKPPTALAAPGRVEGREETIPLGASADGVVKEVRVTAGQQVRKGDLLAVIDCDEISPQIDVARAQADSAREARVRLLRGRRDEERKAAAQSADAAKAVLAEAQEHFRRFDALHQKEEISREAFEQARRDLEVAQANYEKAVDERDLVNAEPLPEEIARANAEVSAAEKNVNVAVNRLEKCNVRAPISGTILEIKTKVGESYSTLLPRPLFSLADESVRHVRAEVDERDISKVRLGQTSIITADGFPGQRFKGQVIQISHAMKPKSILSDDPSQKIDRDVLEVTIELKDSKEVLPVGLRVTAQMIAATEQRPSAFGDVSEDSSPAPVNPMQETIPASGPRAPTHLAGFVLQVAAMTRRENADALSAILRKESFPAFVRARDGDPFYRVDVGPYADAADARAAKDKLKGGGFGTVIERQFPAATH